LPNDPVPSVRPTMYCPIRAWGLRSVLVEEVVWAERDRPWLWGGGAGAGRVDIGMVGLGGGGYMMVLGISVYVFYIVFRLDGRRG
jgi:hypothetical protein